MLDYRHLEKMTDEIGLLQFSKHSIPDINSGYTLDDNARAFIVALHMEDGNYDYALKYALWLQNAIQTDGSWSNLLSNGVYSSKYNSEDSIGRALIACSFGANSPWNDIAIICHNIFKCQIDKVRYFKSPRAIAYALIALCKSHLYESNVYYQDLSQRLADNLISLYNTNHSKNWNWFENYLTYCNGILPQAMFCYYAVSGNRKALKIGHNTLNFLNEILFSRGYLNIVGNQGWYYRGGKVPLFDQQPVDAASIIFSCMEAYQTIGETEYLQIAALGHQWYRGKNIHGLSLYDQTTGGCFDALTEKGLNLNQGAESLLSLLLSDTIMNDFIKQEDITIDKTS